MGAMNERKQSAPTLIFSNLENFCDGPQDQPCSRISKHLHLPVFLEYLSRVTSNYVSYKTLLLFCTYIRCAFKVSSYSKFQRNFIEISTEIENVLVNNHHVMSSFQNINHTMQNSNLTEKQENQNPGVGSPYKSTRTVDWGTPKYACGVCYHFFFC